VLGTPALMDSVLFVTYVVVSSTRRACPRCARSQSFIQFRKRFPIRSVINTICGVPGDANSTYVPLQHLVRICTHSKCSDFQFHFCQIFGDDSNKSKYHEVKKK
jgi:hypothetical protein